MTEEAAYSVPEDGNEDVCGGCGSCNDGDNLICCDSCPAAFHAECAGYANIGEVPNGDWLCWACAKKAKRAFLHPKTALQPQVGDDVMVASEQSGTAFRRARVVSTTDVNLYVAFLLSQQDKVWINKKSKRLWHGTLDAQAWSAGQGSESFPNSRTLVIDPRMVAIPAAGLQAPAGPSSASTAQQAKQAQPGQQAQRSSAQQPPAASKDLTRMTAAAGTAVSDIASPSNGLPQLRGLAQKPAGKQAPAPLVPGRAKQPAHRLAQHAQHAAQHVQQPGSLLPGGSGMVVIPHDPGQPSRASPASASTALFHHLPQHSPPQPSPQPQGLQASKPVQWGMCSPNAGAGNPGAAGQLPSAPTLTASQQPPPSASSLTAPIAGSTLPGRGAGSGLLGGPVPSPRPSSADAQLDRRLQLSSAARLMAAKGARPVSAARKGPKPKPKARSMDHLPQLAGLPSQQQQREALPSQAASSPVSQPARQPQYHIAHMADGLFATPGSHQQHPSPAAPASKPSLVGQQPDRQAVALSPHPSALHQQPNDKPAAAVLSPHTGAIPGVTGQHPLHKPAPLDSHADRQSAGLEGQMGKHGTFSGWPMDCNLKDTVPMHPNGLQAMEVDLAVRLGSSSSAKAALHQSSTCAPAAAADLQPPSRSLSPSPAPSTSAASRETAGGEVVASESEEEFMQALLGLHEAQGTQFAHPKMYGRSDIAAHRIWQEVMSYGGYEGVTTYTLWATIANCLGAPPTATDKSYVCKKYYTENLLAFEQASRRGETGIAIPPVTRDPAEYGRARGGGAKRAATTQTIKPVPKKRKGSQMQATPAAPSAPPTRKVVGLVRLSPAGHLKPGDEVEHRSPLVCYCGGWFRAKVIKVVPGSKQEGYWRHYVECHEFTEEHDASLRRREWVPLLQPEANSGVPAVMIRRAVLPAEPPAPLRTWHVGDRVESFWEDGWWMATVTRIMPDGNVQIRSDPSPRPSSPEVFVRAPDRLRPAHPEEKTGFGMLEPPRDDDMVPYQQWRRQLQWQRHSVDGFTFEAFACAALLPPPSTAPTPASQLEAQAAPAESAPAAADANNGAAMASRTVSTGDMAPAAATETGGISTGEAQASVVVNGDHQLTPNEEVSGDRGADSDLEIDLDNEEFGQSEADMEVASRPSAPSMPSGASPNDGRGPAANPHGSSSRAVSEKGSLGSYPQGSRNPSWAGSPCSAGPNQPARTSSVPAAAAVPINNTASSTPRADRPPAEAHAAAAAAAVPAPEAAQHADVPSGSPLSAAAAAFIHDPPAEPCSANPSTTEGPSSGERALVHDLPAQPCSATPSTSEGPASGERALVHDLPAQPCSATPGTSEGPSSSERAASQGDAQYRTTTDGRVMRIRSNGSLQHMSAELVGGLLAKARASGNAVYVQNLERLLDWVRSVAQKHAAKGH